MSLPKNFLNRTCVSPRGKGGIQIDRTTLFQYMNSYNYSCNYSYNYNSLSEFSKRAGEIT